METHEVGTRPNLGGPDEVVLRLASDVDLVWRMARLARGLTPARIFEALPEHGLVGICEGRASGEVGDLKGVLKAAEELARRLAMRRAQGESLCRPLDVAIVASAALTGSDRERLLVLVCDAGNRLMNTTVVTEGTADRLLMPVREILALVLQQGGRAFAVAHNHPSGDTTPSPADIEGTGALAAAAKTVRLRCLGHVVVADGRWQAIGSEEVQELPVM